MNALQSPNVVVEIHLLVYQTRGGGGWQSQPPKEKEKLKKPSQRSGSEWARCNCTSTMCGDATNWDEDAYRESILKEREIQTQTVFRTAWAPPQTPNLHSLIAASSDGSIAAYSISAYNLNNVTTSFHFTAFCFHSMKLLNLISLFLCFVAADWFCQKWYRWVSACSAIMLS